jgi:hypothetical protein
MAFQNPPFYPFATSNAAGSFSVQSEGYVQGTMLDDPAIRNSLAGGTLASTETYPMWGGVAISEYIPGSTTDGTTGGTIGRATSNANITGFSVFNQAYNWIITPQSPAPSAGLGMGIPFFRLGSGARIAVAMDNSLASLGGNIVTQPVSWDINNQCLQPYDASTATYSLTSITSSYSASTGLYTFAVVAAVATLVGAVGDNINIGGVTGTGAALVNGDQVVTSFTDNQHFSFQVAAASAAIATGALTGTLVLNAGTGALNVRVINFNIGNSKIVTYNAVTGAVGYNGTGSAAIILI